jgi:hypothetical protein
MKLSRLPLGRGLEVEAKNSSSRRTLARGSVAAASPSREAGCRRALDARARVRSALRAVCCMTTCASGDRARALHRRRVAALRATWAAHRHGRVAEGSGRRRVHCRGPGAASASQRGRSTAVADGGRNPVLQEGTDGPSPVGRAPTGASFSLRRPRGQLGRPAVPAAPSASSPPAAMTTMSPPRRPRWPRPSPRATTGSIHCGCRRPSGRPSVCDVVGAATFDLTWRPEGPGRCSALHATLL